MNEVNDLLNRLGELEKAPLIWINKKVYDMAEEIENLNNIINKAIEYIKSNCIFSDTWKEIEPNEFVPIGNITYKSLSSKKVKELIEILKDDKK